MQLLSIGWLVACRGSLQHLDDFLELGVVDNCRRDVARVEKLSNCSITSLSMVGAEAELLLICTAMNDLRTSRSWKHKPRSSHGVHLRDDSLGLLLCCLRYRTSLYFFEGSFKFVVGQGQRTLLGSSLTEEVVGDSRRAA